MYRSRILAGALLVVLLDQISKVWAVARLENGAPIRLIGSWLQLSFARNPGAAFSFATGSTWAFTAFAIVASLVILRYAKRITNKWWALAAGLVLGGALGNLVDRVVRSPGALRGHVVDFIALPNFPLFNVADMSITCAALVIVILSLAGVEPER